MSRKIVKKVLFFLMFSGAMLGMYTFFSGTNDSDKRSGEWKGLVNNMYIGADGHKAHGQSHDGHFEHPLVPHKDDDDDPVLGDSLASRNRGQRLENVDNPDREKIHVDMGHFKLQNDERNGEADEEPEIELEDVAKAEEDIDVRDQSGKVIGQKLFAFGMSRDDIARHKDHIRVNDHLFDDNKYDHVNDDNKYDHVNHDDKYDHVNDNNKYDPLDDDDKDDQLNDDNKYDYVNDNDKYDHVNDDKYENNEKNDFPEVRNALATEETFPDHDATYDNDGEEEDDELGDIRGENVNEVGRARGYVTENMVINPVQDVEDEININEDTGRNMEKPDVAIRNDNGEIVGHKLYAFGLRPGQQPDQDESLSSRRLQPEEMHPPEEREQRPLRDIRPDAAFFDENGKVKDINSEMDELSEFQQRMGLRNPLRKHKLNVNDPFNHHRALFRPLGANGMNPFLNDDEDENEGNPNDAFEGVDRDSVWGDRDDRLFRPHHPQPKQPIETGQRNPVGRDFGQARITEPRSDGFLQRQRGQFMGHDTRNGIENSQLGNLNNGLPNRNAPSPRPRQQFGQFMGNESPQRAAVGNNEQLIGQDVGQNQFWGQNAAAAWNNPNAVVNGQQPIAGLNNNNNNNINNRYPLVNGNNNYNYNNQNAPLHKNNAFGNVNNNLPNQLANGFGQQREQQEWAGANGLGGGNRQKWGPQPAGVPNQNLNQPRIVAVTPVRENFEQQIVTPTTGDQQPVRQIAEDVKEVENIIEEEEQLIIEDLTKELAMITHCIPFQFPTGEASLCVPKMANVDDQEIARELEEAGTWKPKSLKQFAEILADDPTISVVDVGAGIGVYTLAAALMGRQVVAVEPLFINYRLLHKSALNNNVATKIVMVAQALDKESYNGHMVYSRTLGEFNKVRIERIPAEDMKKDPANNIHVTTLNQLVKAVPFKKALLKIDVGGVMEADILNASSKFFNSIEVPYILTHWDKSIDIAKKIQLTSKFAALKYKPKLRWNGPFLDANSLQSSLDFIVWEKL